MGSQMKDVPFEHEIKFYFISIAKGPGTQLLLYGYFKLLCESVGMIFFCRDDIHCSLPVY